MKRLLVLVLVTVAVLLVSLTGGALAIADGNGDREHSTTTSTIERHDVTDASSTDVVRATTASSTDQFDRTEFRITINEDASARWTFSYVRVLENESDRDQFRAFASEFNDGEHEFFVNFRRQATTLTDHATAETERDMNATDFDRRAYVTSGFTPTSLDSEREIGVVELSFTWTNFAVVEDDTISVGDIFRGDPHGLYLGPDQRLVFEPGDGLHLASVDPEPDSSSHETIEESDSITWDGEHQFHDGRPRIVFAEGAPPETNGGASGTDDDDSVSEHDDGIVSTASNPPSWLLVVGLVAVLLGGGAAVVYRMNGAMSTGAGSGTGNASSVRPGWESAVAEEELLSDEDWVINLLESNGGRMKQVNIVEQTEWSKSKVSMLLTEMEEEEQISKLRVGRENIISLKGHEPEATRSPLEDR